MEYNPNGYGWEQQNDLNNRAPYGGGMYVPPDKKFPHFVAPEVWLHEKKTIKRLSIMAGCAMLLFIFLSSAYALIFQGIGSLITNFGLMDKETFAAIIGSAVFSYLYEIIYSVFVVGGSFLIIGLIMHKKGYLGAMPMGKPANAKYLPIVIIGAFGICLLGNIFTSYFDSFIEAISGFELKMPETPDPNKAFLDIFLYFLSTAAVPALVEELIMRGIIMQPLRRYGDWFAILASSMIFGLMHCNLLQIPFAFFAGIAIGYAVITTGSVWTGVLIHFCNNAFSVAMAIVLTFCGEDSAAAQVCNILFYAIIAIGIACAVFYATKLNRYGMKVSPLVNRGRKFFGAPHPFSAKISNRTLFGAYVGTLPMIAAIIVVFYETVVFLVMFG